MTRIALLGCGTVGRQVAHQLISQRQRLSAAAGQPIDLAVILVRNPERDRGLPPPERELFTSSIEDVLNDLTIDAAIEVIGGLEPTGLIVEQLLRRGVDVVSANKTLIAHRFGSLKRAAAQGGANLAFEASVGGAMPIVRAIQSLAGDRVSRVRGILSGSCNYILTRLARDGSTLEDAVDAAGRLGLLEPDPTADLSGRDVAEKLSVLAALLGQRIHPSQVACVGLNALTPAHIHRARRRGQVVKFVAELDERGARVAPVALEADDPLAAVDDQENAVVIEAELSGRIVLRGCGAGPDPTAATILGDVVQTIRATRRAPSSRRVMVA